MKQFEIFGKEFDRCDWYALPIELQRIYLISLSDTQQPETIQSFGGIVCSRDSYKKVPMQCRANSLMQFQKNIYSIKNDLRL